jgi:hypothetical protein
VIFLLQHHVDPAIGVYIIDRYTYYALDFLERVEPDSTKTMGEFVSKQHQVLMTVKCLHLFSEVGLIGWSVDLCVYLFINSFLGYSTLQF